MDAVTQGEDASPSGEELTKRLEYILDPSASAVVRMHRRSHLTNHDLRTLHTLTTERATLLAGQERAIAERDAMRRDHTRQEELMCMVKQEAIDAKAEKAIWQNAVLTTLAAVRDYLPTDGITAKDCLTRVIGAVDNPEINPLIEAHEHG